MKSVPLSSQNNAEFTASLPFSQHSLNYGFGALPLVRLSQLTPHCLQRHVSQVAPLYPTDHSCSRFPSVACD